MTTIHALTIVALCGLTACRGPARPEAQELKECEAPTPPACPRPSCGGNSPVINTFPVNGLRPDGECNHEGAQLMPESLTGGTDNS